ncbi:hypothetical protein [Desulfosporosinus sp. FKB]|uniref:hypothetical protein n=1 Tax=Desulfosporosinus sp. FKB TaxID=1969835 RepID=UPI000B49CF3E|nr:hypothetical protein [Desulfosporosinus sp. FKB]
MCSRRRTDGDETWNRLREWTKGQKPAERLASHIISSDGFESIDPSHPLGGRDGLKDLVCLKDGLRWIGAAYFPRGQQTFQVIKDKFIHDLDGVVKNDANGILFITNQELSLAERKNLISCGECEVEIYHLERLVHILNSPSNYGIRLEFLDIEVTKEEQLAFFAERDKSFAIINDRLERLSKDYESFKEEMLDHSYDLVRSEEEIVKVIEELLDKIWFDRHMVLRERIDQGFETVNPEIWQGALKSAQKVIAKYGRKNIGPWSKFEWGMLNGKLSALRWVLGDDWDMLDT